MIMKFFYIIHTQTTIWISC